MNTETFSVRLDRSAKTRLQKLAKSTGRSRAFLAAEAIHEYLDTFREHGITYEPAAKSKSDLYRDMLPAINSGQLELLDDARLVGQIVGLERRTARGGRDCIDHAPGGHDDLSNAVAGIVAERGTANSFEGYGVYEYYRRLAEGKLDLGGLAPLTPETVKPLAPDFGFHFVEPPSSLVKRKVTYGNTTSYGRSGIMYTARHGIIEVTEEDVPGFLRSGFKRVDAVQV
jgi:predicted DNA-binding protein